MNRPIRRVAVFLCLMMAALMVNSSLTLFSRHDFLWNHPSNQRVRTDACARQRGAILLKNNVAIADNKPSNDQLKYQRVYPQGPLYAHITGFESCSLEARELEMTYDDWLAGTHNALAVGRLADQISGKQTKGASLELTVNPAVQQAARDALGTQQGAVVALDYRTGAVLALYSNPTWDPNALAGHDVTEAEEAWKRFNKDPARAYANRAVREIWPPGSTFKVVVTAAALEAGLRPDTVIDAPSQITLDGTTTTLGNQGATCTGKATLEYAFKWSCNTAFALLGKQLGEEKLRAQAQKFGFGKRFLPALYGAASRFPEKMEIAQLEQSAIGQFDVAATPLQMAMIAATVANDGVVLDPYLVQRIVGPNLNKFEEHSKPAEVGRAMSAENAKLLQQLMFKVVDEGSGKQALIPGIHTGGKTGTAEHGGDFPYAWFVQFGERDDKHIAVAVFLEESQGTKFDRDLGGGHIAAPAAKRIVESYLKG